MSKQIDIEMLVRDYKTGGSKKYNVNFVNDLYVITKCLNSLKLNDKNAKFIKSLHKLQRIVRSKDIVANKVFQYMCVNEMFDMSSIEERKAIENTVVYFSWIFDAFSETELSEAITNGKYANYNYMTVAVANTGKALWENIKLS